MPARIGILNVMEEFLDILDTDGKKTGESKSYDDAHHSGFIHRTVHVWFLSSKNELLLQKRSANKRAYPNHWDISAAGHISAGQTSLEAAKRETQEELGLTLSDSIFDYLSSVEEHIVLNNGTYVNNELQDVYLVHSDVVLSELKLPADEVSEVRWIGIEEFKLWVKGEGEMLVPHDEEYSLLLKRLG